jgi:hypothetical protein
MGIFSMLFRRGSREVGDDVREHIIESHKETADKQPYTEQEHLPIEIASKEYQTVWFDRGYQDALDIDRIKGLEGAEGTAEEKLEFLEYTIAQMEQSMREKKSVDLTKLYDLRDIRDHFLALAKSEKLGATLSEEEWDADSVTEVKKRPILDKINQYLEIDAESRRLNDAWAKTKYAKGSTEYDAWMAKTEEQKKLFETIFTPAEQDMLIKEGINTKKGAAKLLKKYESEEQKAA